MNPSGLCQCGCGRPTNLAKQTDRASGRVKGQPMRFLKGHKLRRPGPLYEVDPETGCWNWVRGKDKKGYGFARHNGPVRRAHVVLYEQHHGPVPDGLELDHLCRNRACVNPEHLEPVTHVENVQRGRLALLNAEAVRAIRASDLPRKELAVLHSVTLGCIHDIKRGRSWKNL